MSKVHKKMMLTYTFLTNEEAGGTVTCITRNRTRKRNHFTEREKSKNKIKLSERKREKGYA